MSGLLSCEPKKEVDGYFFSRLFAVIVCGGFERSESARVHRWLLANSLYPFPYSYSQDGRL